MSHGVIDGRMVALKAMAGVGNVSPVAPTEVHVLAVGLYSST